MSYQDSIINDFKWYFDNNFITHRDGNACLKIDDNFFAVTTSGTIKNNLLPFDFIKVDQNAKSFNKDTKPSIETQAHIVALNNTKKLCSIHVHSPSTVALFERYKISNSHFSLEFILNNEWPELFRYTKVGQTVPFLNPGSKELHDSIGNSFLKGIDIVVLKRHGVIAVGESPQQCKEHIVRLEHIANILLKIGN